MRICSFIPYLIALISLTGLALPTVAARTALDSESPLNSSADLQVSQTSEKPDDQSSSEEEEPDAGDSDKKPADEAASKKESSTEKPADKADEKKSAADADTKDDKQDADDSAAEKSAEKSAAEPAAKSAAKKRKTHKVEPKRLKIDVTLDGTFAARTMEEVPLRPETWTDYELVEVVRHGEKVRKGETLVKFDDEKLNEAIADLELEQRLNELAILKAEEDMPRVEKTLKLDFDAAQRANEQAQEDFDRYQEIDRPMAVKSAEFTVKLYDFMLHYEKDELDQLEKMYEADDLTEETEEIVLKRQRTTVEFAEFSLERARLNREETLNVTLPRYDIAVKEALERAALAQARARMALSLDLNRARYELEQRKKARTKSLDRHAKLLEDRGLMQIKSPADGIVFYGQSVNGRWSDTATLINKYKPHNNVAPGSVLMTIVEPRPLYVTATVDEGKRPDVSDTQKARITLPAEGTDPVGAQVKVISPIPVSPGKFEINFEPVQDEIPAWIVPGMSCKVQIRTYDKKDALVVPKSAVRDDEDNEDQKYVWLVDPDDSDAKPERRNVKLGKRKGSDVEIVKGLKKGDVISLEDEAAKAKKDA
jgi:multidrug efflux pump subunit AcrA (membrane-fusion protein)